MGRLVAEAESRYPGRPPPSIREALERALELVAGFERSTTAPPEAIELAASLARLGYLTRAAETELFEPARRRTPWLSRKLEDQGEAPAEAIVEVSRELARSELEDRPEPDGGAPSWRVPGPGGHVRHYVAIETAARRAPKDAEGKPRLGQGLYSALELKRCWMLGFFVRCCEDAAPQAPG